MADKYLKCSLDECEGNSHYSAKGSKGLCGKHYQRLARHGDPCGGRTPNGEHQAFVRNAAKYVGNDCLLWPYGISRGYGQIHWDGGPTNAHRVVLILVTGEDPEGVDAAHAPIVCHNRLCCNPAHLRWATQKENAEDRILDETVNRGEVNGQSKLTEADVREIRRRIKAGETQVSIARSFSISRSVICQINAGKRWGWLD